MNYFLFETRKAIEFEKVLWAIKPKSVYGKNVQKKLAPFAPGQEKELRLEFEAIREAAVSLKTLKPSRLTEVTTRLNQLPHITEALGQLEDDAVLDDIELFNMRKFTVLCAVIHALLKAHHVFTPQDLRPLEIPEELAKKFRAFDASYSFSLNDYATQELILLQEEMRRLRLQLEKIQSEFSLMLRQKLPKKLRDDWLDDGVVVSKADAALLKRLKKVEGLEVETETFSSIRYRRPISAQEVEIEKEIQKLEQQELEEEQRVRRALTCFLKGYGQFFAKAVERLGWMDWVLARASFALENNAHCPEVITKQEVHIVDGINLPVKIELSKEGREFSPLSISLASGVAVITGANMGGKTVALRTIALLLALAQHGIPVTAAQMSFCPVEYICISGGDDQTGGLSSFGREVEVFKALLDRKDKAGLELLDEPARGTNPEEGSALVIALVEQFLTQPSLVTMTTHFDNVGRLQSVVHWQVRGLKDVESLSPDADISAFFDYSLELVEGSAGVPQNALRVASLMGLPPAIIERARKIVLKTEKGGDSFA